MILIIEGPDGAGKSMLAEKLSRQTGYPIVHRTKPETEEDKARMMGEYLTTVRSGKNMIFDRCWYSEMVYGPIMRDASVLTSAQMYELEKQLAKVGAMIVYCTGLKPTLWKRATRRGEDYITSKDDFYKICESYDALMDMPHHIPVVKYTYEEV